MSEDQQKAPENALKPRSLEEINQEFTNICAFIGDKQHKINHLQREVDALDKRLFLLDAEATEGRRIDDEIKKQNALVEAKKIEKKANKKLKAV